MSKRDDWKETGSGLGHAFQGLGKSVLKSASKGVEWAKDEPKDPEEQSMGEMWKDTGTGLGHAFRDLGKSVAQEAKDTVKTVDEKINK